MAVSGARNTGNVLAAQRVIDMASEISLLEPDAAPLTVVTKRLSSKAASDPKFSWLEDARNSDFATVNGDQASTITSLVVTDSSGVPAESLVQVPRTGEIMFVSAVPDSTHLTVSRGYSGTTAAAVVDTDPLYLLGVAEDEGSTSQTAMTANPTQVDNYTQIFKKSVEASGSWLSSSNITSTHDWPYQQKKVGIDHLVDIERTFLFGGPSTQSGTDGPRRTTGGVLHYATQNNTAAGGTLSETAWETWLRTLFRYGGTKKTVFASPLVISVLNAYSSAKLVTSVGDTSYGVHVMNMMSPHGEVTLVKHNLLQGAIYGGYAIAVDFSNGNLAYRFLNGSGPGGSRDTKLYTNRQTPDRDGLKDEWITECGLQIMQPKLHGVLTGVTG
jgi:hypothetical protein